MATDKKISELPVLSGISANDISVLVNNGVDYQFSISLLLQYLTTNLSSGSSIAFGTIIPQNNIGKNGDVFLKTSTGQFAQKIAGSWVIVYTLPAANAADGALHYGNGLPAETFGKDNDSYIDTLTGVFYLKNNSNWAQVFSMQTGPQGPRGFTGAVGLSGADGQTILSGNFPPANDIGTDGDFYINTNTYKFYGPKTAGNWRSGISMFFTPEEPYVFEFLAGGSNPLVITDWQNTFSQTYGNGEFLVQLADEDGNLQDRTDLSLKRIIDRTGGPVIQTAVSLDLPEYPSGRIIIKYSNLTL